jgi:hypothetical protein
MKIDQHNQLGELQRDVTKLADSLQSELAQHRQKLAELRSAESQKRYTPQHLREQVDAERKRAQQIAAQHAAALGELKQRIENSAHQWSTEKALRSARFANGDTVHDSILDELRRLRVTQEIKDARPAELVQRIRDAGQSGNLAELELLRREVGRREFKSEVERIPLMTALNGAIEAVEIPGQKEAIAAIEAAAEQFSVADDYASELRTGKEAIGTQMRRAVEKHFGTGEQTA